MIADAVVSLPVAGFAAADVAVNSVGETAIAGWAVAAFVPAAAQVVAGYAEVDWVVAPAAPAVVDAAAAFVAVVVAAVVAAVGVEIVGRS